MNLLLIGIDTQIKDILVTGLLPKGYPVYSFDYKDNMNDIIPKKEINVTFIDVDKEGGIIQHLPLIQKLKQLKVSVIVYTEVDSEKEIKILIENGVTAYIQKTNKPAEDIKKLINIIFKNIPKEENRKALRVKVEEEDNVTINFSIPNTPYILKGKVLEISYLGLVFTLDEKGDTRFLKQGEKISKMVLTLGSKRAMIDVEILMIKNDYVGIKFSEYNENLRSMLVKYIFEKMQKL